uniref:Heparan-sulfate 6-O-sulfotransferase n=1 Tax=Oncorhynchus mykiss TaxID=8022 RepID=A0A8C7TQL1_ONCMY
MDCPYNLANNRQVRMLADLSLVGCYNVSAMSEDERWAVLLESAKWNLRGMAFFGLTEYQRETQYLFERIFRLAFISLFTQLNGTRAASIEFVPETQLQVRHLNQWDEELYEYARDLLLHRFQVAREQERKQARERRQQKRRRLRGKLGSTRLGMGWPSGPAISASGQRPRLGRQSPPTYDHPPQKGSIRRGEVESLLRLRCSCQTGGEIWDTHIVKTLH